MSETKIGKFVIINLETMGFFKDLEGELKLYDTEEEAVRDSWFYELENVHILEIKNYYDEDEITELMKSMLKNN